MLVCWLFEVGGFVIVLVSGVREYFQRGMFCSHGFSPFALSLCFCCLFHGVLRVLGCFDFHCVVHSAFPLLDVHSNDGVGFPKHILLSLSCDGPVVIGCPDCHGCCRRLPNCDYWFCNRYILSC